MNTQWPLVSARDDTAVFFLSSEICYLISALLWQEGDTSNVRISSTSPTHLMPDPNTPIHDPQPEPPPPLLPRNILRKLRDYHACLQFIETDITLYFCSIGLR